MIAMFKLFYNTIAACQRPVGPLLSYKCMYVCSLLNGDTTSMFDIIKGSFTNTKSNRLFNLVGAGVHCVKPLNTEKSYNSFWHGSVGHCFICQSTPGQLKSPIMIVGPVRLILFSMQLVSCDITSTADAQARKVQGVGGLYTTKTR